MNECPKDAGSILVRDLVDANVSLCRTCCGLWLPGHVVEKEIGRMPTFPPLMPGGSKYRCPDDASTLVSIRRHGVEIECCSRCAGVWLDYGELERIRGGRRTDGFGRVLKLILDILIALPG